MSQSFKYTILISISTFLLFSCSSTKNLENGEFLLNKVKLKNTKKLDAYDLEDLTKQVPNRRFINTKVYLHIYHFGEKFYNIKKINKRDSLKLSKLKLKESLISESDTSKIAKIDNKIKKHKEKNYLRNKDGNWLMRVVGEPPVIYDSSLTLRSITQFKNYMFANGYLNGNVNSIITKHRKKIKLVYLFEPNNQFILNQNTFSIVNEQLNEILKTNRLDSELNVGDPFNSEIFENERARITELIKNNGYFHFKKEFITFEIDTTISNYLFNVSTIIDLPNSDSLNQYKITKIVYNGSTKKDYKLLNFKDIEYNNTNPNYVEHILSKKIAINKGIYNNHNTTHSQQNLANLGIYKYINFSYIEKNDSSLFCFIKTTPFEKNAFSTEIGMNVFQSLPGPYANFTYKTRNLLQRAELFEIGFQGLIEGQASPISADLIYQSKELSVTTSLTFPYFYSPFKFGMNSNDLNPKTKFNTRYSFIVRPEFRRTNLTAALNYNWSINNKNLFSFSPLELSVISTNQISNAFYDYLQNLKANGNNLYLSFNQSIVTSLPISYTYNDYVFGQIKRSKYFKIGLESGGNIISSFNRLVQNNENKFLGLDIFQYLKATTEFRYYIPVKHKNIFASRFNFGVSKPTGGTNALPYEKYFFTGGSYNNRAWLPRRLSTTTDTLYKFEQPGELLLEANFEYRFKISGFINGAFFTDIGNVWSVTNNGNQLQFDIAKFYKQVGIGAGFGLRFDFSFLILRLDLAKKIYDPALTEGDRFTFNKNFFNNKRLTVLNLGIGYPF